jgi:CheY-like chemotaxis protein
MDGQRILVVDDDEHIRHVVRLFLEDEGYRVLTVANGQAALDIVDDFDPNIILLDMRMPVMDGFEFASRYRARACAPAPIVAFVASLHGEQERQRIAADRLLEKPFDLDDLLDAVNQARAMQLQANT